MEARAWLPWILGAAAAAGVAAWGIRNGGGTLDAPKPPPPVIRTPGTAEVRRGLRPPVLPPDLPPGAAKAIRAAWPDLESGTPEKAAAALATLTPVAADSPLLSCAAPCLEALAPALEVLITDVAVPAMRCAAALARAGGAEGRAALARTGLVARGFAQNALAGTPDLQVETAAMLGFAGGDHAQQLLVVLLGPGRPPEVRAAAAAGLAEAFPLEHRLRADAVRGILDAAREGEPAALRRAALRTIDRAWEAFRPYDPGPLAAAALAPGDPGVRLAAATFFSNQRLTAQGPDLVAAVAWSDREVLATLAETLREMRPDGWREALEKRLPAVTDPGAIREIQKALGK